MDTKLIFEDDDDSSISQLLKSSYASDNILFSSSNTQMAKVLEDNYNKDDNFICFLDVSPNNRWTRQFYEMLRLDIRKRKWTNVALIPIPCIEYEVLLMLDRYYDLMFPERYKNLFRQFTQDNNLELSNDFKNKSLEKLCKEILDNANLRCLVNYNKADNSLVGKFYRCDCDCARKYCKLKCEDCLQLKAERLYTILPTFKVVDATHKNLLRSYGINTVKVSTESVRQNQQLLYDRLCIKFGAEGFKV